MPVRDFGSYLTFADRIYGRLTPSGLASYAQKRKEHISISKVQLGSFDLIVEEALKNSPYILVLFLFLKYLPAIVKAPAEAYKALQEGRLAKAEADEIRLRIGRDPATSHLPDHEREEIAEIINHIYTSEENSIPIALRFTEEHVVSVELEYD